MSGYLHNLARRALRRTSALHSVATLPFAAVPSMPPQEEESRVDIRLLAPSPDSGGAANQVGKGTADRAAQEESARARRAPERAPPGTQAPERAPPRTQAPEPLVPLTVEASVRASRPPARARPAAALADTEPRSAAGAASESGRTTLAGEPRESAHEGPVRRTKAAALHATSATQVIAVPSRRVTPTAVAQGSRPVRAVETATEVHLSIGRVEVAVLAQSPPKETRPRVNRTMSLAEYERRRRERDR